MLFRQGIQGMGWAIDVRSASLVETAEALPWHLRVAIPAVGGLLAGGLLVIATRYDKGASSDYMESIAFGDGRIPVRHTLLRSLSSLVTIASGAPSGVKARWCSWRRCAPPSPGACSASPLTGSACSVSPTSRRYWMPITTCTNHCCSRYDLPFPPAQAGNRKAPRYANRSPPAIYWD